VVALRSVRRSVLFSGLVIHSPKRRFKVAHYRKAGSGAV
jgi:hypothetical protein